MILVRHGQSEFNVVFAATRRDPGIIDPALTELGRIQAEQAGLALRERGVRRIVSSPYTRTLQTSAEVRRVHPVPIAIDTLVCERGLWACDVGTPRSRLADAWPGLEIAHLSETWWHGPDESEESIRARCARFRGIAAAWPDQEHVAVITHWGVIQALTGRTVGNGELVAFDPRA